MATQLLFVAFMLVGTLFLSWNDIQRKSYLVAGIDERHLLIVSFIGSGLVLCIPLLVIGVPTILPPFWLAATGTISINVIAQWLYFRAFKLSDASLIAPLRLITPPLVIITGFFFLHETPSVSGVFGIIVTVLGLWFLLFPRFRFSLSFEPGVVYGLVAAGLFALTFPLDKQTVISSSALFASATIFPAIGVLSFLLHQSLDNAFASRLGGSMRKYPRQFLALSLTFSLGALLTNQALNYSLAAYAASLKRLQAVWTIVFSGAFLKERNIVQRCIAALIMLFGIVLSVVTQ